MQIILKLDRGIKLNILTEDKRTVVVTGIGIFTSIGCTRSDFWDSLVSGKSGIDRIQAFDPYGSQKSGGIRNSQL